MSDLVFTSLHFNWHKLAREKQVRLLCDRIYKHLSSKYFHLIQDKNFNMPFFKTDIAKQVNTLKFPLEVKYESVFKKAEKMFLSTIAKNEFGYQNGLLMKNNVDSLICQDYNLSLHFPLRHAKLRTIIQNEGDYIPLDKYKAAKPKKRPLSKYNIRTQYCLSLRVPEIKKIV